MAAGGTGADTLRMAVALDLADSLQRLGELRGAVEGVAAAQKASTAVTRDAAEADRQGATATGDAAAKRHELGLMSDFAALKGQALFQSLSQVGSVLSQTNPQIGQMLTHIGALGPMVMDAARQTTALGSAIALGPAAVTLGLEVWVREAAAAEQRTRDLADAANTGAVNVTQLANALRQQISAQGDRDRLASGAGTQLDYQAQLNDLLARRRQIIQTMDADEQSVGHRLGLNALTGADDVQRQGREDLERIRGEIQAAERHLAGSRASRGSGIIVEETGSIVDPHSSEGRALLRGEHGGGGGRSRDEAESGEDKAKRLAQEQIEALAAEDRYEKEIATERATREQQAEQQRHDMMARDLNATEEAARHELEVRRHAQQELIDFQKRTEHELQQQRQTQLHDWAQQVGSIGGQIADVFIGAAKSQGDFGKALADGFKVELEGLAKSELVKGLSDEAEAIGLAFINPPAAGNKAVSGAMHLAIAALAGGGAAGLGAAAGAAPAGGAAAAGASSRPSQFDNAPRGGPSSPEMSTVVVNVGTYPVATAADIGQAVHAGLRALVRRDGPIDLQVRTSTAG